MIQFQKNICGNLEAASSREWLETNGLGGFSSSTITGLNTRRYHGLLVAATKPPVGRLVLLSKLEETLVIDDRRYELSANQYPGTVHPQGFRYQTSFKLDPFPIFTYEIEGIIVEKSVFMVYGENTTIVQYEFRLKDVGLTDATEDASLTRHPSSRILFEVRPLVAFRDYHSLLHENTALDSHVQIKDGVTTIRPSSDLPELHLAHDADVFDPTAFWCRNFEYHMERERGFDFKEDLFSPFAIRFDLKARPGVGLIASTERREASRADNYRQTEIERRQKIVDTAPIDNSFGRALAAAADQFIAARETEKTVIAGYHWFSDWGRDTMIALPGLTLTTGRFDVARSILLEFARYVDRGMLPNRFPDAGETPEYNTVDATLWYFEAIRSFIRHTDDSSFVRDKLYEILVSIIDWHEVGTRYNIRLDEKGLLYSGQEGVQLTWMDAKVGDWVVTPRRGLAVEIQALWFNALKVMEGLAGKFGDEVNRTHYAAIAQRANKSFNELFWNEDSGCLFDVINGAETDASIRPNQVLAVSLPHSMLSKERAKKVVDVVERELLTPYGLRSLAPGDPNYRGRYTGDPLSRDGAYHQGTVWAWLLGPFITAYVKVRSGKHDARERAKTWIMNFDAHLSEAGLGQISEIFDGDPPHLPRGCIAQAWSVGELLRAAVEDVHSSGSA